METNMKTFVWSCVSANEEIIYNVYSNALSLEVARLEASEKIRILLGNAILGIDERIAKETVSYEKMDDSAIQQIDIPAYRGLDIDAKRSRMISGFCDSGDKFKKRKTEEFMGFIDVVSTKEPSFIINEGETIIKTHIVDHL